MDPTGFPGSLWPLVGPRAAIGWRGNTRVSGEVSLVGGIGSIETHDRGFVPYWTALGRGGVGFDGELGLLVGFELSKSLSSSFAAGASDPVGTDAVGLRFDFRQLTMSGSEQVYGIGLQLPASGVTDERRP